MPSLWVYDEYKVVMGKRRNKEEVGKGWWGRGWEDGGGVGGWGGSCVQG
jgi:hypothetical protein